MGRKPKISVEEKIFICEQYLNGIKSLGRLAKDNGINTETIRRWINQYREYGSNVFQLKAHNRKYTKEFKQEVVEAYLRGERTPEHLAVKYDIPAYSTVYSWIIKYNNLEVLKDYDLVMVPNQNLTVDLDLEGPSTEIYKVKKEQFKVVVNLSEYVLKEGDNNIPVQIESYPDRKSTRLNSSH